MAKSRAQANATKVLQEAEAYKLKQHTIADNEASIMRSNAQTRLDVAKNKSQALIKESKAESQNSNNMEPMRIHTEKMKLAGAMQEAAWKGKMVVAGKNGGEVLNFFKDTLSLVGSRGIQ